MSKLILDFDLSAQRRRPPKPKPRPAIRKVSQKKAFVQGPTKNNSPNNAARKKTKKTEPEEEEKNTKRPPNHWLSYWLGDWLDQFQKLKENSTLLIGILVFVFVSSWLFFLFLKTVTHAESFSRDLLVPSLCTTQDTNIVCHAESCNLKGACHGTSKDVVFNSMQCADTVRTITIHRSNGVVKQYPAYYLRIYNTTTFAIDGRRALFSPVLPSCRASSRPRKVGVVENVISNKLRGTVVWVAPRKYKRYSLYRGKNLVASIDEDWVLVEKVAAAHYVYQFALACHHWEQEEDSLFVFGEDDNKRKEVKAFNYCQ